MSNRNHRRKNPKARNPVAYAMATGRNGSGTHKDTRRPLQDAASAEDLELEKAAHLDAKREAFAQLYGMRPKCAHGAGCGGECGE